MSKIPLSLDGQQPGADGAAGADAQAADAQAAQGPEKKPVMGWFAVGFGLLGIFTIGFVFVPLGLVCSLIALFTGQALWGFMGLMLAAAGFITSPKLWFIVGMGWLYATVDWQEILGPLWDILKMIGIEETTEV